MRRQTHVPFEMRSPPHDRLWRDAKLQNLSFQSREFHSRSTASCCVDNPIPYLKCDALSNKCGGLTGFTTTNDTGWFLVEAVEQQSCIYFIQGIISPGSPKCGGATLPHCQLPSQTNNWIQVASGTAEQVYIECMPPSGAFLAKRV